MRKKRISKLSPHKTALAKLAFVGLQQRLLSSISAFVRTLKAHRKTLQRLLDGQQEQVIETAAQTFVDGSTTDKTEDLGLEDDQAEAALESDEEVAAEAASVVGAADASTADLRAELVAVDDMLAVAEPAQINRRRPPRGSRSFQRTSRRRRADLPAPVVVIACSHTNQAGKTGAAMPGGN